MSDQRLTWYGEIHTDDPPIISSAHWVNLDSRMSDNILYVVDKSNMPL